MHVFATPVDARLVRTGPILWQGILPYSFGIVDLSAVDENIVWALRRRLARQVGQDDKRRNYLVGAFNSQLFQRRILGRGLPTKLVGNIGRYPLVWNQQTYFQKYEWRAKLAKCRPGFSPNPASDFIAVQLPELIFQPMDISIFDSQGKLTNRTFLTGGQLVDVRDLTPGIYAVKVLAGERAYAGRFVKG